MEESKTIGNKVVRTGQFRGKEKLYHKYFCKFWVSTGYGETKLQFWEITGANNLVLTV